MISGGYDENCYACFSTDIIHNGHISIIQKAAELGELIRVLADEAVAKFKRYPPIPLGEDINVSEY